MTSEPPSDDDREALARTIAVAAVGDAKDVYISNYMGNALVLADAILAAGYRKVGPVTDAEVTDIHSAVALGQQEYNRYAAKRASTCPPSQEFPIDRTPGRTWADIEHWRAKWAEKYPPRSERSFIEPLVRAALEAVREVVK